MVLCKYFLRPTAIFSDGCGDVVLYICYATNTASMNWKPYEHKRNVLDK